ncbi:MAG TPA: 2'-5' RNA ligase family protein [Patescibacteria group bacterium]|uniref:Cyclic phosphodiesterase-like protein n=1 Tax=Candidatus Woesebacteria bacterium RBG_13_46_13 TaxID=1802479 RepID=A0A1F7X458_9BACT|nr:MAG: hypothetical protein A2Y68_00445 [Candidatus Woesebacteria bacterium RBG_13_46_13]HJX59385.1 2'-5' RNA ligase family protein [Patescibacteria group bacterium]
MEKAYSLWITPNGEAKATLDSSVKDLSAKFHGPTFEPHMTLLGPIYGEIDEIVAKAGLLAKQIKPFQVSLGQIDFSTTYFQCVFVRVQTGTSLLTARSFAQKTFNDTTVFMPHISLYYGNDDIGQRKNIAKSINLPRLEFLADKIIVTPATQNPQEWEHLAEIPLGA